MIPLCRLEEIPDRTGKGFTIKRDGKDLEILVVRAGDRAYGYINCCPHYGITLEWMDDKFTDLAGEFIQCSTHGARFQFEDGYCVWGPCAGASLAPIALVERQGRLHIEED